MKLLTAEMEGSSWKTSIDVGTVCLQKVEGFHSRTSFSKSKETIKLKLQKSTEKFAQA